MSWQPCRNYKSLAAAASFTGDTIHVSADESDGISWVVTFGNVTGALKVEVSNDKNANPDVGANSNVATARWLDITSSLILLGTGQPAGTAGVTGINIGNLRFAYARLSYTHSSGTGTFYADLNVVGG
jgi:hypothetical protein